MATYFGHYAQAASEPQRPKFWLYFEVAPMVFVDPALARSGPGYGFGGMRLAQSAFSGMTAFELIDHLF